MIPKRLYYILGLLAIITTIGLACFFYGGDPEVEIPVVLFFPDDETQELYQDRFIHAIELADRDLTQVSLYVARIDIKKYDASYYHGITDIDQYCLDDAIGIFPVDTITDGKNKYGGFALRTRFCHRSALVLFRADKVLTHEFGHLFGLEHVDDPNNFMYPEINRAAQITDKQQEKMYENALGFTTCLPAAEGSN